MLSADSVIVLLFENMMDVLPYFTTVANMILSDVFTDCDYVEFNQATRKVTSSISSVSSGHLLLFIASTGHFAVRYCSGFG